MVFSRCLLSMFIAGIIGAVVSVFAFGLQGISVSELMGSIITATVGAALLLLFIRLIRKT